MTTSRRPSRITHRRIVFLTLWRETTRTFDEPCFKDLLNMHIPLATLLDKFVFESDGTSKVGILNEGSIINCLQEIP
jgi:hypothetical protein